VNTTAPGPDERRARALLIRAIEGNRPAPEPRPAPPVAPAPHPRADWWDRLYDEEKGSGQDATDTKPRPPAPAWEDAQPDDEATPAARRRNDRSPGRRLQAAYVELAPRTRTLLYNGGAAALGWGLGLLHLFSRWITSCQHDTGHISAALTLGAGITIACGALIDRRTRHWWGPLPWLCRTPTATAVLALALYAPASAL
jgi:hypothetical protein